MPFIFIEERRELSFRISLFLFYLTFAIQPTAYKVSLENFNPCTK